MGKDVLTVQSSRYVSGGGLKAFQRAGAAVLGARQVQMQRRPFQQGRRKGRGGREGERCLEGGGRGEGRMTDERGERGRGDGWKEGEGEEKPLIKLLALVMSIKCSRTNDCSVSLMSRLTAKGQALKLSWIDAHTLKNPI